MSDDALRLAVARAFLSDRLALGLAGTIAWSSVLGTDGRAALLDLGLLARPLGRLALGLALRRAGTDFHWNTPAGDRFETGLAPAVRGGAAVEGVPLGPVRITLAADLERGSAAGTELSLGTEVALGAASLRTGLLRPSSSTPVWTGGLGLELGDFRGDLAYELRDIVGPRVYFGVAFKKEAEHSHE